MSRRRAAFIDRDGVLNRRPPPHQYVTSPAGLELLPGVAEAVDLLRRTGFLPIVVSNQRGVALGLVSEQTLREIEARLIDAGVLIEAFYYCRHDSRDACDCRKPRPGLLLQAAADFGLALPASAMIGDQESDIQAGRLARCRTLRIGPRGTQTSADMLAPDLRTAAELLAAHPPGCATER